MSIRVLGVYAADRLNPDPLVANMFTAEGWDGNFVYETQVFAARPADAMRHAVSQADQLPWKMKVSS